LRITVLGRYGPYPAAGGACSGYLINASGTYLLLDCGAGVVSRLAFHVGLESLSGLILSHLHGDHISDALVLRYALQAATVRGLRTGPLSVWTPFEPRDQLELLQYRDVFNIQEPLPGQMVEIGTMAATPIAVKHSIPTFGWRFSTGSGTVAYSADSEECDGLICLARNADLFLCEATFTAARLQKGGSNHLSARQAGCIASQAQVKRLLLTHLSPWEDPDELLAEAQTEFPQAELAVEQRTYEI
jgi:ribonuclease BN (tRNA processing enzyme)